MSSSEARIDELDDLHEFSEEEAPRLRLTNAVRNFLLDPSEVNRSLIVSNMVGPLRKNEPESETLEHELRRVLDRTVTDPRATLTAVAWCERQLRPTGALLLTEEAPTDIPPLRGRTADTDDGPSLQAVLLRQRLLTVEQVKALPPPEPLIGGVLNRRKLAFLWGKPGSGKSFVALDWGLSVGTGHWWFGREVTQGLVVYLAAEGSDGLGLRIEAWQRDHQVPTVANDQFLLLPNALNLLDRDWGNALVDVAGDLRPALVVADTLARSMPGGDENGSRDTGIVIDTANRVQQASGATVLFVHHDTREGSNLRGHSGLDGAADTSIECKRDGQSVTLKSRKQKDMADFDDLKLHLEHIDLGKDDDGRTLNSCVLWSQERVGVTAAQATEGERALLAVAWECCGSDGLPPSKLQDVAEMSNSSFYRHLKNLLGRGALVNVGTENRPRYRPAEAVA